MLLLDNIIFKLQKFGGVSTVWDSILSTIDKEIIDVAYLEAKFKNKTLGMGYIGENLPLSIRRYLPVILKNHNPKVFHSSYFRICKNKSTKNIVTVHDFIYEKYDNGLRKRVHLAQKNYALKNADAIVCVSENTKQDLVSYLPWIDESIVRVIHNGVGNDFFVEENSGNLHVDTSPPYILFVGSRSQHKNFDAVISLMKAETVELLSLLLITVGGGELSKQHELLLSPITAKGKYKHISSVSNSALRKLYNEAYCVVYPSLYEGFGMPPLEAMACGCPVICADSSSIPEVVGNAGLLFNPHKVEEAEEYLFKLNSEDYRNSIIQKGLERSRELSSENTGKNTVDLYKEFI
jgi:glycosyltransferase involved in cell wall biosynthesis